MERQTVQKLFVQHYAKMLRVARTILGDEQESKDVVSDIFANLLHGRTALMSDTLDCKSKATEHYLLRSVRNQCLKRLRHESLKRQMGRTAAVEQKAETDTEDERLTDIDELVAQRLTAQEQRIFRLRFSYGYSYEEIATQEGISRVAVWKHLSHALSLIRNHYKKQ